jgi:hypothetical protein
MSFGAISQVAGEHCCNFAVFEVPEDIAVGHLLQGRGGRECEMFSQSSNRRYLSFARFAPALSGCSQSMSLNFVFARCAVSVLDSRS